MACIVFHWSTFAAAVYGAPEALGQLASDDVFVEQAADGYLVWGGALAVLAAALVGLVAAYRHTNLTASPAQAKQPDAVASRLAATAPQRDERALVHGLNNALTTIVASIDIMRSEFAHEERPSPRVLASIDRIEHAVERLLVLSRRSETDGSGCRDKCVPESAATHSPLFRSDDHDSVLKSKVVLLCDDEDTVRMLARRAMEQAGCEVIEAATGDEALRAVHEPPQAIDLLITDIAMPDMSGSELAACLRRTMPKLAIVYISGYSADILPDRPDEASAFLEKPFKTAELVQTARALVGVVNAAEVVG